MKNFVSLEKTLEIYLNGGVLKQIESELDVFLSEEDLLSFDYEKIGEFPEHTMFEKWHETSKTKAIMFKIYCLNGKPLSSGLRFWNYNLNPVLKLAEPYIKNVEVFFDESFDYGALIINSYCVIRFDFDGNKHPKISTLETDKQIDGKGISKKIATGLVRSQFLEVKSPEYFQNNENVEQIFELIRNSPLKI